MVSRLAPFQHAFVQRLSELGVAYRGSPIVEGPGVRYLDDSMRGGDGIGRRFLAFVGDDVDSSTREAVQRFCASFSEIVESRRSLQAGIALVRPDGYVAYAAQHGGGESIVESLRSTLALQTEHRQEHGTSALTDAT